MIIKKKVRYVLVYASKPVNMEQSNAKNFLYQKLLAICGIKCYSAMRPKVVEQLGENKFILRINRGSERDAVLALAFIRSMPVLGSIGFYSLKTSGTLKALKKKELYKYNV
ncbi:MAG: Rpp14/Pop5 family protein [Candidatus Micrarchaeia archaeon]